MGFPGAETIEELPGGEIERASKRVFFILPWRHDFLLAPLRHPRGTDFGQQMDIEFIRKDHHLIRLQLLRMPPNPGQSLDSLGSLSFALSLARFHTQPISWSQRRTVHADTSKPCLAWSWAANVAPLHRVRHQP